MTPEFSDSGLPQATTQVLAQIFTDAGRRFADAVLKPPGRTAGAQAFNQARAAQQLAQVDQVLLRLKVKASAWVTDANFPQMVHDARARADRQADEAGVNVLSPVVSGSFTQVDEGAARVFAGEIARDLYKAADSMADRGKRVLRRTAQEGLGEAEINQILAGGVIAGKPTETIRQLRDALKAVHGGTVPVTDKNGDVINFDAGYYAEMVARTRTREAVTIARHDRLKEDGIDLVAIVGRVSQNFCTAFLGQVFSLDGKSGKYPAYDSLPGGGPPFHPNCTKSTRPFIEELAGQQQLADAEPLDDAKKLLGQDTSKAQRMFKDLQLHAQVKDRYADTEQKLFGGGSKAA